jgi:hypothetical protein
MALSKIDLANMVENQMPQSLIADNINFRNILINGDMSQSQRSTSVSSITGSGYNTVDRYTLQLSSQGTWTQSQSTDVPTGQGFAKSLKMDCTTADASPSASDEFSLRQKIEGQNLQYLKKGTSSAESTTVSFWVKSNKIGTYICELRDSDNSRQINKSYTISSANTWEKKTITYDGDTTGALDNDNARSLDVVWWLGAGSNFTSGTLQTSWGSIVAANRAVGQVNLADSTSNEWYITGVQLEAGTASDFEFLPYDVNLRRCLRYYYQDDLRINLKTQRVSDAKRVAYKAFPVPMRASPTFTATESTEISNTSVNDTSKYGMTFQQSGSDGSVPRYNAYNFSSEL